MTSPLGLPAIGAVALRKEPQPGDAVTRVCGVDPVILVRDDDELIDVLKQGQTVLSSILSLDSVQRELDEAIVHVLPGQSVNVESPSSPATGDSDRQIQAPTSRGRRAASGG